MSNIVCDSSNENDYRRHNAFNKLVEKFDAFANPLDAVCLP